MNKVVKNNIYTLIGVLMGVLTYNNTKNKKYGHYNIGLSKYFEYSLIPIYLCAALYSNEKISKILLAAEAGFHIGVFIDQNF